MGGQKSKKNGVLTKFEVLALLIDYLKSGLIFFSGTQCVLHTYIWELMQKKTEQIKQIWFGFWPFSKIYA